MSADNWTHCPRCTRLGQEILERRAIAVNAAYGNVPVDEFDARRRMLQIERDRFEKRDETFREDYEIYGAETGTVTVAYSGVCTKCGLTLKFNEEHTIEEVNQDDE